jgi:hypothetical protein
MANRAYLYSRNEYSLKEWDYPGVYYYDSRHNIPVGWFFFFRGDDLRMIDVHSNVSGSHWQEVKFVANRERAIELFIQRRYLLDRLIGNQIDNEKISELLREISNWTGKYLLMDPVSVLGAMSHCDDDQWHADKFAQLLECIDRSENDPTLTDLVAKIESYSNLYSDNSDKCVVNLIGCTYSWDE